MLKDAYNDRDDHQLPDSADALFRRDAQRATAGVPPELKRLETALPPPKQKRLIALRPADETPRMTGGHCPPWMEHSYRPARTRLALPPTVMHRDRKLNPCVDLPPGGDLVFYNDATYPWVCVCRITAANGKVGSGVLVGPRHILTASHVVDWSTDRPEKIEVLRAGSEPALAVAFDTLALAFTQIQGNSAPSNVLDEDYAVLVVEERLGDRFGWFGTKVYDSGWDGEPFWMSIGYPATSVFPTFQKRKWLDEDAWDYGSARAMTTSADLLSGHSGSPMFGMWDGLPFAVAVMSSDDPPENENWCAGGSDLTRLVNIARTENP